MADEADQAELEVAMQLAEARSRRNPTLAATGFCHFCHEKLEPGLLFCDEYCRDDAERVSKMKRMTGKN